MTWAPSRRAYISCSRWHGYPVLAATSWIGQLWCRSSRVPSGPRSSSVMWPERRVACASAPARSSMVWPETSALYASSWRAARAAKKASSSARGRNSTSSAASSRWPAGNSRCAASVRRKRCCGRPGPEAFTASSWTSPSWCSCSRWRCAPCLVRPRDPAISPRLADPLRLSTARISCLRSIGSHATNLSTLALKNTGHSPHPRPRATPLAICRQMSRAAPVLMAICRQLADSSVSLQVQHQAQAPAGVTGRPTAARPRHPRRGGPGTTGGGPGVRARASRAGTPTSSSASAPSSSRPIAPGAAPAPTVNSGPGGARSGSATIVA